MIGRTVGQYEICKRIGVGGMGTVYLAEHALLGRLAAVKLLLPELSQDREVVTRFFNEARAASAIHHPGIVEIYDFGHDPVGGGAYLVMEVLEGESLAARVRKGPLPPEKVLAIARQAAGALGAAHAKQIIHRDLKPENIFLVADRDVAGGERIKLLDFGIAKLLGEQRKNTPRVTRTGTVIGTPAYMSPEQCRGVGLDHRSDLYSLGCVLFELCAGRPPFLGDGDGDVLSAHIQEAPPDLAALAPQVSPALEQLILRLLAKRPARRFASAEEVIAAVDQASLTPAGEGPAPFTYDEDAVRRPDPAGDALPTIPDETVSYVSQPGSVRARSRRRFVSSIAASVAVVGAVALLALSFGGGRGSSEPARDARAKPPAIAVERAPVLAPSTPVPIPVAPIVVAPESAPAPASAPVAAPTPKPNKLVRKPSKPARKPLENKPPPPERSRDDSVDPFENQ